MTPPPQGAETPTLPEPDLFTRMSSHCELRCFQSRFMTDMPGLIGETCEFYSADKLTASESARMAAESETERLRAALDKIAEQWKSDEIMENSGGSSTPDDADFERGYDSCIDAARQALAGNGGEG